MVRIGAADTGRRGWSALLVGAAGFCALCLSGPDDQSVGRDDPGAANSGQFLARLSCCARQLLGDYGGVLRYGSAAGMALLAHGTAARLSLGHRRFIARRS